MVELLTSLCHHSLNGGTRDSRGVKTGGAHHDLNGGTRNLRGVKIVGVLQVLSIQLV
jgi:hypothetical protein